MGGCLLLLYTPIDGYCYLSPSLLPYLFHNKKDVWTQLPLSDDTNNNLQNLVQTRKEQFQFQCKEDIEFGEACNRYPQLFDGVSPPIISYWNVFLQSLQNIIEYHDSYCSLTRIQSYSFFSNSAYWQFLHQEPARPNYGMTAFHQTPSYINRQHFFFLLWESIHENTIVFAIHLSSLLEIIDLFEILQTTTPEWWIDFRISSRPPYWFHQMHDCISSHTTLSFQEVLPILIRLHRIVILHHNLNKNNNETSSRPSNRFSHKKTNHI